MAIGPPLALSAGTPTVLTGASADDDLFTVAFDADDCSPDFLHDAFVNKPSVVLVPFTAAHGGYLAPLARALAQRGLPSLTIDLPGHGQSAGPRGRFEVPQLFDALDRAVTHAQERWPTRPVVMAGSSWGGDLSLLYALWDQARALDQGRMSRLAAVVGQAMITPWQRAIFRTFRRGLGLLYDANGLFRPVLQRALGRRLPVTHMFRARDLYRRSVLRRQFLLDPLRLRSYHTASYLDYLTYMPSVGLEALPIPLLMMVATGDRLVPLPYAQRVENELRQQSSRVCWRAMTGAGHAVFQEQPLRSARVIDTTLAHLLNPVQASNELASSVMSAS